MPLSRPTNRKSRSHLAIDTKAIDRFIRTDLADRFQAANETGADYVQNFTPIDTGRLMFSARAIDAEVVGKKVRSGIRLGGVSSPGVFSEQTFERDVSYSLIVEIRQPFIRPQLPEIGSEIVDRMKRKQGR